jgi:asparagine synthase (glutamine-hydrolysing)
MASYDFWGVGCLNKFNGMWAFVIYDNKEDKFFIFKW